MRLNLWPVALIVALLGAVAITRPTGPARVPPPPLSVVLILLDDVGPSEAALLPSLFGAEGLASKGVSFTRCTAWPVCSPTRYAMLTGRYPRREGIGDLQMAAMPMPGPTTKGVALERNTIAEVFAPSYQTAYFGKWHLGRPELETGLLMGLSALEQARVSAPVAPFVAGFEYAAEVNPDVPNSGLMASSHYDWWSGTAGSLQLSGTYTVDAQREAFLEWWASTSGARMAWLSWSAAHSPYDVPPGGTLQGTPRLAFEQAVAYADMALADVLAAIDLETTYVLVTSDNGTPDDARPEGTPAGRWKFTTWEGGISVPLVIAGPGIGPGTSSRLVSLVDLPATLAELVGLELTPGFEDSCSFADELGAWVGEPARAFTFSERYSVSYDDQTVRENAWALRRVDPDGPGGPMESVDAFLTVPGDQPLQPPQSVKDRLLAELATIPPRGL